MRIDEVGCVAMPGTKGCEIVAFSGHRTCSRYLWYFLGDDKTTGAKRGPSPRSVGMTIQKLLGDHMIETAVEIRTSDGTADGFLYQPEAGEQRPGAIHLTDIG